MRSQSRSASSMSWVVSRIATSSWRRTSATKLCTSRLLLGSSPVVGSSSSIRRGEVRNARATATFCCWPRDRCSMGSRRYRASRPRRSRISALRSLTTGPESP